MSFPSNNLHCTQKGHFMSKFYCPNVEDYSPCQCRPQITNNYKPTLDCKLSDIENVRKMFHSATTSDIEQLFLIPLPNQSYVPKDLFFKHRFTNIVLWGNEIKTGEQFRPEIHPEAFGSSTRHYTKLFKIVNCDMALLNFTFLTGFHQLDTFSIYNSAHFHLQNFPQLPNLINLHIVNTTGLNEWTSFPTLIKGLVNLEMEENGLYDDDAGRILDWILKGPSKATLSWLDLCVNKLTRIPDKIKSFKRLGLVFLDSQKGTGFGFISALSLPGPLDLYILNSHVSEIEHGIFKGMIVV